MKFFDSPKIKKILHYILPVFIFYTVAAASFNGFFAKWAFCDNQNGISFEEMYDGTAHRPFVHRQLIISIAKTIPSFIPEKAQEKFVAHLQRHNYIADTYNNTKIQQRYIVEYYLVYFISFICLFCTMFILRKICNEITGNKISGILTPCLFALIFPLLETVGGYFYDFGEIFFFSLATLLAIKGYWLALIFISPVAEYNKESFLFFLSTLFPLLAVKLGNKKTFAVLTAAMFFSGLVYLYVKSLYAGNDGGATEFHLFTHINYIFNGWFNTEITYGVIFGRGMFLPHVLFVAWMIKCTWKKLSTMWKFHIKIALTINLPLFILFCYPNELRNFSLLYIGFIAMLSIFIKEAVFIEQKK